MLTYFWSPELFKENVLAEIAWKCIDSKWNECTSLQLRFVSQLTSPVKISEWKPSVMKILSTSTSPSEIYGQINLTVEITTPSNLGPSTKFLSRKKVSLSEVCFVQLKFWWVNIRNMFLEFMVIDGEYIERYLYRFEKTIVNIIYICSVFGSNILKEYITTFNHIPFL